MQEKEGVKQDLGVEIQVFVKGDFSKYSSLGYMLNVNLGHYMLFLHVIYHD